MKYLDYSFAKINLFLDVLEYRKEDGYHNLKSIFVPIDWYDTFSFTLCQEDKVSFSTNDDFLNTVPYTELTIGKAIELLRPYKKNTLGAHIQLNKNVPYNAGLGIASSNAVTVLKRFNQIWECGLNISELKEISRNIGSDCSFFFEDQICLVEGKGDIIEPLALKPFKYPLWLLKPKDINISTALAYQELKNREYYHQYSIENQDIKSILKKGLEYNDLKLLAHNIFFDALKHKEVKLLEIESFLKESGGIVQMSGSGSCMYIIFKNKVQSEEFLLTNYNKIQKNFDFYSTIL